MLAERFRGLRWLSHMLGVLLVAAACGGGLPQHAAPTGSLVQPDEVDLSDVIEYRQLTRADFKASVPAAEVADSADDLHAHTCAFLRIHPDTQITVSRDDSGVYTAGVVGLRFVALMDRKCSWWNDNKKSVDPAYVLEHEQIHFALTELVARNLNGSLAAIREQLEANGSTEQEVADEVQQRIRAVLEEALTEVLERNAQFDEETSLGVYPAQQKAWLERVTAELQQTRQWAASAISEE